MENSLGISILDYPHSLEENSKFRARLLKACETDLTLQKEVRELCRRNILLWIDLFCWTKDPRRKPDVLPFICYDAYQRDYILEIEKAINEQYDELTDKSRDMGISWMILYVFSHKWLFEDGSDFRVGSRKEDYVDKLNDIDTLLEKVRFNLKRQPLWLLPKGFNIDDHAAYMRIVNPENNNTIIGESANPHFGSGGRRKAILLDEFAKWELKVAEAAWTATADVSKCRFPVSTPVGSANKFAQLAEGTKEKIKKITLHWTLHPEKSKGIYYVDKKGAKISIADSKEAFAMWQQGVKVRSPWYDNEATRRKESDLAQEVDIDYLRAGHPFFSLTAIAKQNVWQFIQREVPTGRVPYGRFIQVKLVEIDNKIEIRELSDEWLRIFELPKPGYQYVVSGDVSEGLAKGDESFLIVREKITRNVVACANGLFKPDDFAIKLERAGLFYNRANVAPENNNHGYSVCEDLKKTDCNLYYTKRVDAEGKVSIVKAGWTTDPKSRPAMLDQFEEELRKSVIELRDETLLSQCKTFVKNPRTGKAEADGAFLDDGVMACAIGSAIIKEIPYKEKKSTSTKRKERRNEVASSKNAGFGFKKG